MSVLLIDFHRIQPPSLFRPALFFCAPLLCPSSRASDRLDLFLILQKQKIKIGIKYFSILLYVHHHLAIYSDQQTDHFSLVLHITPNHFLFIFGIHSKTQLILSLSLPVPFLINSGYFLKFCFCYMSLFSFFKTCLYCYYFQFITELYF